jgi:hypothetical protein
MCNKKILVSEVYALNCICHNLGTSLTTQVMIISLEPSRDVSSDLNIMRAIFTADFSDDAPKY